MLSIGIYTYALGIKLFELSIGVINMKGTATQQLLDNKMDILKFISNHGNILNRSSLMELLHTLQKQKNILNGTTLYGLTTLLVRLNFLESVNILYQKRLLYRYLSKTKKLNAYEIALSIAPKKAHLSHLSALYINGITNLDPSTIYINYEQSPKPINKSNAKLTQKKVDQAFLKPVRKTNNIATFIYHNRSYTVILLNGKHTNYIGVQLIKPLNFSSEVRVSNIERSLIEATIRPSYSGGVSEVLLSFKNAKSEAVSINRLLSYLKKMNYIYPYFQNIYFYVYYAHYNPIQLNLVQKILDNSNKANQINFYLDHQLIKPKLDSYSKVYYPENMILDTDSKEF